MTGTAQQRIPGETRSPTSGLCPCLNILFASASEDPASWMCCPGPPPIPALLCGPPPVLAFEVAYNLSLHCLSLCTAPSSGRNLRGKGGGIDNRQATTAQWHQEESLLYLWPTTYPCIPFWPTTCPCSACGSAVHVAHHLSLLARGPSPVRALLVAHHPR